LAAASGRRRWPICWCCLDRGPGSFDVEDATTLSWSSAAVCSVCVRSKRSAIDIAFPSVCLSVRLSVCDAVESCVNRGRFAESVYTICGARDLARLYKKNSANISQPFSPGAGVVM